LRKGNKTGSRVVEAKDRVRREWMQGSLTNAKNKELGVVVRKKVEKAVGSIIMRSRIPSPLT